MMVATLTNRALTAILIVSASQNTSSGDMVRNFSLITGRIADIARGQLRATAGQGAVQQIMIVIRHHFMTWKFRVVASTEPHRVSRSTETINTSAAPTEIARPACSTRPLALSLLPLAAPVILIVKSSVASAHPFGRSERQEATAATSPATPTMDAGNWPGGPENLSSNGSSIVTCPGTTDVMVIENS